MSEDLVWRTGSSVPGRRGSAADEPGQALRSGAEDDEDHQGEQTVRPDDRVTERVGAVLGEVG
jgi:hypothetical protein